MAAEVRFRAMGSDCHVVVVGDPALLDVARGRVEDLERRWSRFRPDSEVSGLNAAGGTYRVVSAETCELVRRAVDGWRRTGGAFDPTVLGDVVRAGYDRTYAAVAASPGPGASALHRGCAGIEVDAVTRTVRLPRGTGFDPGGIGKGLAADLVVGELLAAGADGACVNVGGDVRAEGAPPDGLRWSVAVEHPGATGPVAVVALAAGAVATSTVRLRTWVVSGVARHHLVDPRTGTSYDGPVASVSVVARESAWAEVVTKAALLAVPSETVATIDRLGCDGIVSFADGTSGRTPGLAAYL
jgi:thiamine biosynthesis lipoprotein